MYLGYVDDFFVLVRSEKIMDKFFNVLNNAHEAINFTIEKENNDELAFLMYKLNEMKIDFWFRCTERKFLQDVI